MSSPPYPMSSRGKYPTLSSRLERKRNGGIYRSWYDAGGCEDSSTTLRSGRNDKWGGVVGMSPPSVIPGVALPTYVIPPPTLSSRLERKRNGGIYRSWCDVGGCEDSSTPLRFGRNDMRGRCSSRNVPPLSSRLERKRNGGIYRSWCDAGGCEDSSTTLRFGRNDISGWCGRNVHPLCHPGRGTPHVCHPAPPNGVIPTGAYHHPCHPDWSVSGMEGSIAVGAMWEGARIPPLRFASVGMTWG